MSSVVVTNQGSGYPTAPTIVFTPTNGESGATAFANIGRTVASITVDNGGTAYPATTTLFGGCSIDFNNSFIGSFSRY